MESFDNTLPWGSLDELRQALAAEAPLTGLAAVIEPRSAGWLDAAVGRVEAALRASDRPALAARLQGASSAARRLEELGRIVRLEMAPGDGALAEPHLPWRTQSAGGDERHFTRHRLPQRAPALRWSSAGWDGDPLLWGDQVLCRGRNGRLTALGRADGRPRWSVAIGAAEEPVLAAGEGRVLVATRHALLALAADNGAELWQQAIEWAGEPIFENGVAYCPHTRGIEARRAADGELLWSATPAADWAYYELRLAGEWLWVFAGDEAFVLDAASGETIARYRLPGEKKGYHGHLLLGHRVALLATNRLLLWNPAAGSTQVNRRVRAAAASDRRLYLRLEGGAVEARALDADPWRELWQTPGRPGSMCAPLAAEDGVIYDAGGVLRAADEAGQERWQVPLGCPLTGTPTWDGTSLLLRFGGILELWSP